MSNTYTKIHIQVVFAIKYRDSLISTAWKVRLYKYMSGIIQNKGHKLLAINGIPDHVHVFFGMRPNEALSDLVRDVKRESTTCVNDTIKPGRRFGWQEGFGGFSYSHEDIDTVVKYILHQEEHHRKKRFREEYEAMLKEFEVEYDPRYLFEWFDEL